MLLSKFKTLRNNIWVLVAIALVCFIWLQLTIGSNQEADYPPFAVEFELTDHNGQVRTNDDFAGRWMLVFFGFANCPDICPTTLAEVAIVMDKLGTSASKIQPLFISIDPERDTPLQLGEFVPMFDSNIIGLTGTPGQIEQASKSFHVYYEKVEEASAPNGYTMGHSSQLLLFDPQGGFAASWTYGTPAEEILSDLNGLIKL